MKLNRLILAAVAAMFVEGAIRTAAVRRMLASGRHQELVAGDRQGRKVQPLACAIGKAFQGANADEG